MIRKSEATLRRMGNFPFDAIAFFIFKSALLIIFVVWAVRMVRDHLRRP